MEYKSKGNQRYVELYLGHTKPLLLENDNQLIMVDSIALWDRNDVGADAIGHHIYIGATWNRAQMTITKAGAFSNYTWKVGDYIRITGGTLVRERWMPVKSKSNSS